MSNLRVARRYSEAVMASASDQNQVDRLASDFALLQEMIAKSRDFVTFLRSPVISHDKKKVILAEILRSRVSEMTMGFLNLLTAKGRAEVLPEIVEEFFRLRDERLGLITVDVRAATELTEEQHRRIQRHFQEMTGKSVRIALSVDKQVRGGFVARVGDTVFDGSVRRQLEILRERFATDTGRN